MVVIFEYILQTDGEYYPYYAKGSIFHLDHNNTLFLASHTMLRRYSILLERSPLLTKAISAGIVTAGGDLGAQLLVEQRSVRDLDWKRVQRFCGLGMLVSAPVLHYWYGFLAKAFPTSPLRRVLADQFVFAPVFLGGFIFGNEYFQDTSMQKAVNKVKRELQHTVLVLANNLAAVFWNGYLSWKLHHQHHDEEVKVA